MSEDTVDVERVETPSQPVMQVKRKKAPEGAVVVASDPEPGQRSDGETRTVTAPGQVQMATPQTNPREVEELTFGGITIERQRF
jgi:hypothetical protein